jgi:uncharacterized protein
VTDWNDRQVIEHFLASHNTMTLATCGCDGPWAAAVFYAHDADFAIYFKSDPKTRHIQHIKEVPDVAATVHDDGQDWKLIRGLQMFGSCSRVMDQDVASVERCYKEKFPFLNSVTEYSTNATERVLADRLKNTPIFQLRPHWIRLIDNTRSFGHKTEMRIPKSYWDT